MGSFAVILGSEGVSVKEMLHHVLLLLQFHHYQAAPAPQDEDLPPMPYQFSNLVAEAEADPNGVYWTQDEGAEESNPGRVEGSYSVWLPDGRLRTVTYYVDGESGFVPTVTHTDNYNPTF